MRDRSVPVDRSPAWLLSPSSPVQPWAVSTHEAMSQPECVGLTVRSCRIAEVSGCPHLTGVLGDPNGLL